MSGFDSVLRAATLAAKGAWRQVAPRQLRSVAQPLVLAWSQRRVNGLLARPEPQMQAGPLVVSGLIAESKGISEAARLTLMGLEAAGYRPVAHDLRKTLELGPGGRGALPTDKAGGVWIVQVNAPEALHALAYLDPASWRGRYRIGYWAYELPRAPELWVRASAAFHEIWAPSRFVAEALEASGVTRPVRVMPHPAWLREPAKAEKGHLFSVLAMGDISSSPTRKNLAGAVDIYTQAFPEAGKAKLTVKLQGAADDRAVRKLKAQAARGDIDIIAETLSAETMAAMIASADVLLSPHRAEGFGLALAEAFLAGVPALATGWSGNMDFMEHLRELSIGWKPTPVVDPSGVYAVRGQTWAEPDVADAAAKLKALFENPERRAKLGQRGRAAVLELQPFWSREALEETMLGQLLDEPLENI